MVLSNLFSSFGFFTFAGAEIGNNNRSLKDDIYSAQDHQVYRRVPLRSFSKTVKLGSVLFCTFVFRLLFSLSVSFPCETRMLIIL